MTLQEYFAKHPKVAIAFSGGVDSSYLLYAAQRYARKVKAYYAKSAFQPRHEFADALRLAQELQAPMRVLELDILRHESIASNPENRCYYCKREIFSSILAAAHEDGFSLLCDGTNASDDLDGRPGVAALRELQVQSPLLLCGLTKEEIRSRCKEAGLFVWNKPAYACLATRVEHLQQLDLPTLQRVEAAEELLMRLGFVDFRVRVSGRQARLELREPDMTRLLAQRQEILHALKEHFDRITLNLEAR